MNLRGIQALILRRANLKAMDALESEIAARPDVVRPVEQSPVRFEIVRNAMQIPGVRPPLTLRTAPHLLASKRGILRSLREVSKNPARPKTRIAPGEIGALEQYAASLGVAALAYTKLPRHLVFQNKAVLYDNAIVLVMEMDKAKIETAPGPRASEAVHETYHYLGDAANQIAGYLRKRGYATHAGPPLNGLVLYPPLAQRAGLGWRGRHGMLITPQFGPRMRLAAVFANVENLPFFDGPNEHQWIEGFCRSCGQCIRRCPTRAILEEPVERENGLVKTIEVEKCFPYFVETFGCSVCIRVCPFNRVGYERAKRSWEDRDR